MEKIIVGFSKPKKWMPYAWMIQKAFGTPFDHVYIKYHSDTYDRDVIYQASGTMVNFMGKIFEEVNMIVDEFEIKISPEKKVALMQFAIDNAGRPYGIKEAFGMGIVRLVQLCTGRKIKNPFGDKGQTYVCSELAGYILEEYAGAQIPVDLDNMTPLDVYNYLIAIKAVKETLPTP